MVQQSPHVKGLLPVASAIQDDLCAYDFTSTPAEDLFGVLLSQLARRSQRLLLGQEWTPTWLAEKVVGKVFDGLPLARSEACGYVLRFRCHGRGGRQIGQKEAGSTGSRSRHRGMNRLAQAITVRH